MLDAKAYLHPGHPKEWDCHCICVFVYLCICDKAHLHPGHAKEWDEGERDEIEQGRLSRLENLQQLISLIYKLNLIFQFDIEHVLATIDFSNVIQSNPCDRFKVKQSHPIPCFSFSHLCSHSNADLAGDGGSEESEEVSEEGAVEVGDAKPVRGKRDSVFSQSRSLS